MSTKINEIDEELEAAVRECIFLHPDEDEDGLVGILMEQYPCEVADALGVDDIEVELGLRSIVRNMIALCKRNKDG